MLQPIQHEIDRLVQQLKMAQTPEGTWTYAFEAGVTTDAYMIILLKVLEIEDEPLIASLVRRIESKQEANGSWKLFQDERDGNLSITIQAYYALLYSGHRKKSDPPMQKAQQFILSNGGIKKAKLLTKLMLAVTGQIKWPLISPIPLESVLLPPTFFINIYDFSIYGRAHFIPVLLLSHQKFRMRVANTPNLKNLYLTKAEREPLEWEEFRTAEYRSLFSTIQKGVSSLIGLPSYLHALALESIKRYMLDRIESDGTFYNYFSSTFFMIFALIALGYPKNDPTITKAVMGFKGMTYPINGEIHIQFTTSTIWDTALISYALQEAGVPVQNQHIQRANRYLLSRQHNRYGDWVIHNSKAVPGGWGFSDANSLNPDVDDTTASLRALAHQSDTENNWKRGLAFTLSMQNDDGGFPAFERNVDKHWVSYIPVEDAKYILADPSTADLTGRTLEFLGNYTHMKLRDKACQQGVKWLVSSQERNGSWYGRWGVCYIYGTWAALTGLAAVGLATAHSSIQKAVAWLGSIQNQDGGWGESCYSDIHQTYVPLKVSTLTHTAWAVDALIAVSDKPTNEINQGIAFLIREGQTDNWTNTYPVGQGLAGYFYSHYHSYRYIYSLLALSHYRKKFGMSFEN